MGIKKAAQRYKKIKFTFIDSLKGASADTAIVMFAVKKDSEVLLLSTGQKKISLGIGKKKDVTLRKFILHSRKIISLAKQNKIKKLAITFSDIAMKHLRMSDSEIAEILAVNFEMANYEFVQFKTSPEESGNFVEEIVVISRDNAVKKGFRKGQIIGEGVNTCRVLSNTPGGSMTPRTLAKQAKEAGKKTGVNV